MGIDVLLQDKYDTAMTMKEEAGRRAEDSVTAAEFHMVRCRAHERMPALPAFLPACDARQVDDSVGARHQSSGDLGVAGGDESPVPDTVPWT